MDKLFEDENSISRYIYLHLIAKQMQLTEVQMQFSQNSRTSMGRPPLEP